jgi:hypothetical protein
MCRSLVVLTIVLDDEAAAHDFLFSSDARPLDTRHYLRVGWANGWWRRIFPAWEKDPQLDWDLGRRMARSRWTRWLLGPAPSTRRGAPYSVVGTALGVGAFVTMIVLVRILDRPLAGALVFVAAVGLAAGPLRWLGLLDRWTYGNRNDPPSRP